MAIDGDLTVFSRDSRATAFVEYAHNVRFRSASYPMLSRVVAMPLCCFGKTSDRAARILSFFIFLNAVKEDLVRKGFRS